MTPFLYDGAAAAIVAGSLSLGSDTLKVMLVNASYVAAKSDTVVKTAGGSDAAGAEINVPGYVPGYGGAGRQIAGQSVVTDTVGNAIRVIFPPITWTPLGGAQNDTITAAVLIKEGTSDDTTSQLLCYWPITPYTTNGAGFQLVMDPTNGNLNLDC
ncbi:MAG: hypothetical protein KGL39_39285 [Patescibacteria group bacterium]|nr:hypothetical protein [Patescibacteria group bacterium]